MPCSIRCSCSGTVRGFPPFTLPASGVIRIAWTPFCSMTSVPRSCVISPDLAPVYAQIHGTHRLSASPFFNCGLESAKRRVQDDLDLVIRESLRLPVGPLARHRDLHVSERIVIDQLLIDSPTKHPAASYPPHVIDRPGAALLCDQPVQPRLDLFRGERGRRVVRKVFLQLQEHSAPSVDGRCGRAPFA